MIKDEALKLAIEAAYLSGFNASAEGYNGEYGIDYPEKDAIWKRDRDNDLTAIEQALAQPAQEQEPVAWVGDARFAKGQFVEGRERRVWWECNTGVGQPLYTAPPQRPWVGLTDEDEIDWDGGDLKSLIKAIEAKLKEKNT